MHVGGIFRWTTALARERAQLAGQHQTPVVQLGRMQRRDLREVLEHRLVAVDGLQQQEVRHLRRLDVE